MRNLSVFIKFIVLTIMMSTIAYSKEKENNEHYMKYGDIFILDGGDGDQSFFKYAHKLEYVEANWFPNETSWGEAFVFQIQNGYFQGQHIALTSRVLMGVPEQINQDGYASVIVHLLPRDSDSFSQNFMGNAIGMSVIDKVQ